MKIKSTPLGRSLLLLSGLLGCLLAPRPAMAVEIFTLAAIGDQQVPVSNTTYYPSFTAQTDWLAANAQANNIRFVTQLGDIVEHGNNLDQWDRAEAAMATLDTGVNADGGIGIPWNVVYGNHEMDTSQPGTDPAGARADRYREYFGSSGGAATHRYQGQVEYGGASSNDVNTYHFVKSSDAPDAREYLMLSLEYDVPGHKPGSTPAPGDIPAFDAIAWAQGVIDANPGMPTVISTHVFEGTKYGPPNNPYTAGPGRNSQAQIFDKLVKDNSQVFMVLSGHTSQDIHQVKNNAAGLPVLQMVTDYNKVLDNGGDGFMRLIELDEGGGEIRVQTFTPGVPQNPTPRYLTDANSQFTIEMDWETRFDGEPPPPPPPVQTDLIGHWKFDDGSGTTAADSSASGYDADQTIMAGSWITGKAGGAYNLPRFSLDAAESDVLNLAGTDAVTLSAWVTNRNGTGWEGIAGFEGTGTSGDIYSLKMEPTNSDLIVWTVNTVQIKSTDTLSNYAAATEDGWVHLVGVFDQGESTLYINGSPVNTGTATSPIDDKTPPGTFNIGRYFNTTSYQFTGSIDDVQVYDGALSADDVAFLFNNPGMVILPFDPNVNGDENYDVLDMQIILSNFVADGEGGGPEYNQANLNSLLLVYGGTVPEPEGSSTVPEPGAMFLLLFGAMGLLGLRRRK